MSVSSASTFTLSSASRATVSHLALQSSQRVTCSYDRGVNAGAQLQALEYVI